MILVSGFNVYPNEIEDVIAMMPGVLEVGAVGVPDEKSGEAVKVVIVRKDPTLTAEQVKAHARENLTGYKQPKYVEFRTELPKTNVGKILRRELRDAAPSPDLQSADRSRPATVRRPATEGLHFHPALTFRPGVASPAWAHLPARYPPLFADGPQGEPT